MIDTHCHLSYFKNYNDIIKNANQQGVNYFLNVVEIIDDCYRKNMDNFINYQNMFLAIGVHPLQTKALNIDQLENLVKPYINNIIALGETGLDLYYQKNYNQQMDSFIAHLNLCRQYKKNIVIHTRAISIEQMNEILIKLDEFNIKAQFHCFTFNIEYAKLIIEKNHYISISGIATFKKSEYLHNVISYCPKELLLIETDSPYLAPEPFRGKQNQPMFIDNIYKLVAKLKNLTHNELLNITRTNFETLFQVKL